MEVGLPQVMVHFIMCCITSVKTNVMENGNKSDFSFQGEVSVKRILSSLIFLFSVWINSPLLFHKLLMMVIGNQ